MSTEDYKSSSVISLITNYKRRGMFEARLVESKNEKKNYVYLKVGEEDFYIDLEENEILAGLFSEKEMVNIIENLIVENLRLETNLRIASKRLSETEHKVLELSAKGYSSHELEAKLELSGDDIEAAKNSVCQKLNNENFNQLVRLLREKKLQ